MLPNFFVVGVQKAATTSLHNYLANHPDIYLPEQKETKFFIRKNLYKKGIQFYEEQFFSDWSGETAVGEVDPDYIYYDEAIENIGHHLDVKKLKFIFLLRNPVERAFSHYLMTYRRGLETLSFEDAINQESSRLVSGSFDSKAHYSYVDRGFYLRQIERFLLHVDKTQMLFLLTEDLKEDPGTCLKRVFEFLNVSMFTPENIGNSYHGAKVPISAGLQRRIIAADGIEKKLLRMLLPYKPLREKLRTKLLEWNQRSGKNIELNQKTRRKLVEMYRSEIRELELFLGRNLDIWLTE